MLPFVKLKELEDITFSEKKKISFHFKKIYENYRKMIIIVTVKTQITLLILLKIFTSIITRSHNLLSLS